MEAAQAGSILSHTTTEANAVHGFADEGFGHVADAFATNLRSRAETGAACAVYHRGRLVVDLYGGLADTRSAAPWTEKTLTLGFSVSKGLMALCAYLAQQRGLLDFDKPVVDVWPEFAANGTGKDHTLIRDLFSHRAGLVSLDTDLSLDDVAAWTPVVRAIEAQRPTWTPGTSFAYHALTYGWLTGEVLRRATGLMPGALLAEYLTAPLGVDAWIGLPIEQEHRVARMYSTNSPVLGPLWRAWPYVMPKVGRESLVRVATMGGAFPFRMVDGSPNDLNSRAVHAAEIPALNAILDARALAKIYAAAVSPVQGPPLLSPSSIEDATTTRSHGAHWRRTFTPPGVRFSTGFLTNGIPYRPLLSDTSFGHDGASGSLGFADADAEIGFGYLNNRMSGLRDQRANSLTTALRRCL